MKKNLIILLCLSFVIMLAWCKRNDITNNDVQMIPDNRVSSDWLSAKEAFNQQIETTQYLKDLENFVSLNILSITENKPFTSEISFTTKFDENSTLQWWLDFFQKKLSKTDNLKSSDIQFNIETHENDNNSNPLDARWNFALLTEGKKIYLNLNDFEIFMWEGNMSAKLYNLLWETIRNKRVDLEAENGLIVSVGDSDFSPYLFENISTTLKLADTENKTDFVLSLANLVETINSHIDLWISTNNLTLISEEVSYSKFWDEIIQKTYIWSFQWSESAFDVSFIASQKWLEIHLYNISEFDIDMQNYIWMEREFNISLQEWKKSEYKIELSAIKYQQKVIEILWTVKFKDSVQISADFILEPLEFMSGQKVLGKLAGTVKKYESIDESQFHILSWDILLLSNLLSSL